MEKVIAKDGNKRKKEKGKPHSPAGCLLRGVLVFLGTMGTIGCYTTCFPMEYNWVLVAGVLLLLSIYCAFLYCNRIFFNLGYILLTVVFAVMAFRLQVYAKSGFSAILNISYDVIDQKYMLPAVRYFAENIADRYTAITAVLLFLGAFAAILLNCVISGSMSFGKVFLLTFPIIAVGLYFDRTPSLGSALMILLCYVGTVLLKKRYRGFSIGVAAAAFTGAVLLPAALLVPESYFSTPPQWNRMKDHTDRYVESFMITGFSGLFNRYSSAGGVSGGKLGGISSIRPDFETDLLVKLVPYGYDTVYLKAFVGKEYFPDQWTGEEPLSQGGEPGEKERLEMLYANRESALLEEQFEKGLKGARRTKVQITNVGANAGYPYLPYYAQVRREDSQIAGLAYLKDVVIGTSPLGRPYEVTSYPYPDSRADPDRSMDWMLREMQYYPELEGYKTVPRQIEPSLQDFCRENQITGGGTQEIAEQIKAAFYSEFSYSFTPGSTPLDQDFVQYFLEKQKKGFCVHFASAATLLFRARGIPARYVEGYAIPYNKILDGELAEGERFEDWFSGESSIGETAVVKVEVNDSMAHAWVEIYEPQFGWVPVEVTPPSAESFEDRASFWSLFGGFFGGGEGGEQEGGIDVSFGENMQRAMKNAGETMKGLVFLAAVILSGGFLLLLSIKGIREYRILHSSRYDEIVRYQYRKTICRLACFYKDIRPGACQGENRGKIEAFLSLPRTELERWAALVEKASYSPYEITGEEADYCKRVGAALRKKGGKRARSRERIAAFWAEFKIMLAFG